MSESDAGKKAETPERVPRVGGGTAEGTDVAHQADAACDDKVENTILVTMEQALCRENMLRAHQRVVSNKGAPGVDGTTVDELMPMLRECWDAIRKELLNGTYKPSPVLKVEIPKPGGGVRTLGVPTVLDRLIQQALYQALQSWYDVTFSDHSFGFRLGRSAQDAVLRAREHVASGRRWVVDMDLEKFFDRVNHDVLMSRLARRIKDKRILKLIRLYLQAGMMEGGVVSPRAEGTPQGGPLSPLLSNILLDELDKELERRGHRFVRYADDCNIYVKSKRAGERVLESIERFLNKLNAYTTIEARERFEAGERTSLFHACGTFFTTFLKNFIVYKSWKNGRHGFILSILEAFSRSVRHFKLWERHHTAQKKRRPDG